MNFGQNLYQWFLSNAQSLVLMAIVVIGIYLGFKREFSKLIGFLVPAETCLLTRHGNTYNLGIFKSDVVCRHIAQNRHRREHTCLLYTSPRRAS